VRRSASRTLGVCACVVGLSVLGGAAPSAAKLPDNRGYELVSPADKGASDIVGDASRVHIAAGEAPGSPMAAVFGSLAGFGDVQGMGVATEYLSERDGRPGTQGWSTHAITPPQGAMSVNAAAHDVETVLLGVSADLSRAVLQAWTPLTSDPYVTQVENLYRRSDLRAAGGGLYELLTQCTICVSTDTPLPAMSAFNQVPALADGSADLGTVLFESRENLTSDASGENVKMYEASPGGLRLLTGPSSANCPGGTPCSSSEVASDSTPKTRHSISSDGSRVVFGSSGATGQEALYQFDDHGTADPADDTITQINASERTDCASQNPCTGTLTPDPNGPTPAQFEQASTDGSRVFFTSKEQLTDDAPTETTNLYMWSRAPDPQGHHLTLVNVDRNASDPAGDVLGVVGGADDGQRVYFVEHGQLVDDPGLPTGQSIFVYLWDDTNPGAPSISYVGKVADPRDQSALVHPLGAERKLAQVTPDGRNLVFNMSDGSGFTSDSNGSCSPRNANLSANGKCSEVYLYNADAHSVTCVSCTPGGVPTSNAVLVETGPVFSVGAGHARPTPIPSRSISDDGRYVFFTSGDPLVPGDVNGKADAYEYDTQTNALHLLSSGQDPSDSVFMGSSASGDDAFLLTREALVGWDVDENYDLYDARVNGGFPDPPPLATQCSGEACQGSVAGSPPPMLMGTATFFGSGNVASAPRPKKRLRCRRGFVRRRVHGHVRCVRRKTHRRAHRRTARRTSAGGAR
jgi:hypothetical protein